MITKGRLQSYHQYSTMLMCVVMKMIMQANYKLHGSHFFGLTNFPDFSLTFPVFFSVFQYFLKFFFYLKYGTIFAGFSLLQADKFP